MGISLAQAVTISNTDFKSSTSNYNIYPNTTINISQLSVDQNDIALYDLTGGGNFTNIGAVNSYLQFYNLVAPYNNVRWQNLTIETTNVDDFIGFLNSAELIEVYYAIATTGTGQSILQGGDIKERAINLKPYIFIIGGLVIFIFLLFIGFAEQRDRKRRKSRKV